MRIVENREILADLHTHTIFSGHAYSTLKENVDCGTGNGMDFIAITDHYYQDDGMDRNNEIARLCDLHMYQPKFVKKVIAGVELNLNQPIADGIDKNKLYANVPWRLIGLHSWFINVPKLEMIPYFFEQALTDSRYIVPTAFAHIERGLQNYSQSSDSKDIIEVLYAIVDLAIKYDIFLEINETSLKAPCNHELLERWVRYAHIHGAKFCLGTDAHVCYDVGEFSRTIDFIASCGLENAYFLNCDEEALKSLLI